MANAFYGKFTVRRSAFERYERILQVEAESGACQRHFAEQIGSFAARGRNGNSHGDDNARKRHRHKRFVGKLERDDRHGDGR